MRHPYLTAVVLTAVAAAAFAQTGRLLTGKAALGGWRTDAPGVERRLAASDMAPPAQNAQLEEATTQNRPEVVPRGQAMPKAPAGFQVALLATGMNKPRTIRTAPNGDAFVAESDGGRILVFRGADNGEPGTPQVFAEGLQKPYGIAFHPLGPEPRYVYVGEHHQVVRFPYKNGDLKATGPAQVIVPGIPSSHHWTRDVVVSKDGARLFVAVGSGSNVGGARPNAAGSMQKMTPEQIAAHEKAHGRGAAWGPEEDRATVRTFDPEGKGLRNYATGVRNCSGLTVHPMTGDVWCAVNERDGLGDDVPFEYVTSIRDGGFYGWPWYYIGGHEEPRRKGERPDLKAHVVVPDVLLEAHTAPLGLTFYEGSSFPAEYRGNVFVALHGSWNRSERAGYKVVRIRMSGGKPTGVYEDFLTGFVVDAKNVWGRPVGVGVLKDGSLLVSDDGSGSIWRVSYRK
jgi:glucose/arabinose dehydrogenase